MCKVLNKHHVGVPETRFTSDAAPSGAIHSGVAPMAIAPP